jgi:hypothetical protein
MIQLNTYHKNQVFATLVIKCPNSCTGNAKRSCKESRTGSWPRLEEAKQPGLKIDHQKSNGLSS